MNDIDKFINDFTDNYDGGGCCSDHEWFDDDSGIGHGVDCVLGKGRGDSNGYWNSKGFGKGLRFGGDFSATPNKVIGRCYINTDNLYGQYR